MAYTNVVVTPDVWINLNTASGAPVGTAVTIQNLSVGSCYVQESATEPTTNDGAILFNVSNSEMSKVMVDSGSVDIWAKACIANRNVLLAVYE